MVPSSCVCPVAKILTATTDDWRNLLRSFQIVEIVPWAARPMLPLYRRMGTASFFSVTFSRNFWARWSFQPLIA